MVGKKIEQMENHNLFDWIEGLFEPNYEYMSDYLHQHKRHLRNRNQEHRLICPILRDYNHMECTFGFDFSVHYFFAMRVGTSSFPLLRRSRRKKMYDITIQSTIRRKKRRMKKPIRKIHKEKKEKRKNKKKITHIIIELDDVGQSKMLSVFIEKPYNANKRTAKKETFLTRMKNVSVNPL